MVARLRRDSHGRPLPPLRRCRGCGGTYAAWAERDYCQPSCPGRPARPDESLRAFRQRLKDGGLLR